MTRVYNLVSRNKVLISLLSIIAFCLLLRFLHLLNSEHYYIISPDSHYFHWLSERYLGVETADRFMRGHGTPSILGSGLSYPLAWISIALSSIFSLSRTDALTLVSKLLPPFLGVIGVLLLYWMGSRMYSRSVGIFAAFSWAVFSIAIFFTGAGYLDRDALSVLLITAGVFVFYISKDWHYSIGKLNVGWIWAALLVVGIQSLLFLEWNMSGPVILLAILMIYVASVFLASFFAHVIPILLGYTELPDLVSLAKLVSTSIANAWRETNWRPLALIVCLNILAVLMVRDFSFSMIWAKAALWFNPTGPLATTSEAQGLTLVSLFSYFFLTLAVVIGICITAIRRRNPDILWLSWFISFFFVGLFVVRIYLSYAAVAGCMLSGIGLSYLYGAGLSTRRDFINLATVAGNILSGLRPGFSRSLMYEQLKKTVASLTLVALLFLSMIISLPMAYNQGSGGFIAADNDWYDALNWLKGEDKTPEDAVIMSWWGCGYWILDIARRTPVVDNGGRYEDRLGDIGRAYCTSQDSEAVEVMQKYGASYLLFSKRDIASLPSISDYGLGQEYGDGKSIPPELEESLFARALGEDFDSEELDVAYRNDDVVILSVM